MSGSTRPFAVPSPAHRPLGRALFAAGGLAAITAWPAAANAADGLDSGNTAWILTSTALVLFMTIPGLALFYGGLVRTKNVLSVLMQCLALTALLSIVWLVVGYSLAFDTTGMVAGQGGRAAFIGGLDRVMLAGVGPDPSSARSPRSSSSPSSAPSPSSRRR